MNTKIEHWIPIDAFTVLELREYDDGRLTVRIVADGYDAGECDLKFLLNALKERGFLKGELLEIIEA